MFASDFNCAIGTHIDGLDLLCNKSIIAQENPDSILARIFGVSNAARCPQVALAHHAVSSPTVT